MTDPNRLVKRGDFGAKLLASARSDSPLRGTRVRVAASLGLAASVGAAAVSSSTASAGRAPLPGGATGVAGGTPAAVGAGAAQSVSSTAWLKLLVGMLIAGTIAGGGIVAVRSLGERRATAPSMPASSTIGPHADLEPTSASEAPAVPAAGAVAAPRLAGHGGIKASRTNGAPSQESLLARELRSLDAVRSAIARRDAPEAFAALDAYERAFPNGALRTEAAILRVEAVLAHGDSVEARRLARDLLAEDPSGPQARRLRTLLENP